MNPYNLEGKKPTPGRIVWYQTDGRNYDYYVPAIVRITTANLVPEAVKDGVIEDLDSDMHVHLFVLGGHEPYPEMNVPFDGEDYEMADGSVRNRRRTWRWPDLT